MQRTKVHTSPWNTAYPVYDGHGNMIATLTFNRPGLGTNGLHEVPTSYGVQLGNLRRYDVWGGIRGGQKFGYPNHRYCANLGHKVDDETGLIYMRARYYEPSTGRFISEDPARVGWNWHVYCGNDSINYVDYSGLFPEFQIGKFTVRLDRWYFEEGTGAPMRDFHWKYTSDPGELVNSVRADGTVKHGAPPPEELDRLLNRDRRFNNWRNTTLRSGNRFGIGYTTLDAAFMADPGFVMLLFSDIGTGFALFSNAQ